MRHCIAALLLIAGSVGAQARDAQELLLYKGKPLASWQITVADFNGQKKFDGDTQLVSKPQPDMPDSVVSIKRAAPHALSFSWQNAWYASLRFTDGTPLDLRPYLTNGTLEFDLKVADMHEGGVSVVMSCGSDCSRKVNYLREARALSGKGWQHLSFAMSCFVREGDDFSATPQPFALDASGSGELAVANVRFKRHGKATASCPDYRTESVSPKPLEQSWSMGWWMLRHQKKLDEIQALKAAGQSAELVFIGDSITEGWEKSGQPVWAEHYARYHALDLGFGGDHTENVLWRLQHGELDGIAPKVTVLMIGTNNTGDRQEDPRTTAAGIERLIAEIQQHLPQTKILLLAVFPRDARPDSRLRQLNQQVSTLAAGFADGQHVFFLDINTQFLGADGTLSRDVMPDLLHPNEKGYAIWADSMAPLLQKLLAQP